MAAFFAVAGAILGQFESLCKQWPEKKLRFMASS
jgi:hypothetical protein